MKNKIFKFFFIFVGIIIVFYFIRTYFSDYNLQKSVSACILAKKQTSKTFDLKKAKKYCKESILQKK